ncbi:hypothetical protein BKA83DRAFT_4279319 [Pisolithus microcarpus]|nr:hypothetical protein BKA83DRAFT_4279319 [Pisolithus microcarpus]
MLRDGSMAAGLFVSLPTLALNTFQDLLARDQQLSTGVPPSTTSQGLSFRNISDTVQITLPVVQGTVAAVPAVGAPLAAAIGGLLAVLKVIDTSIQNREALDNLTCQLYTLYRHLANAPIPRTPIEETNRRVLTKVLEDTTNELRKLRGRRSGSARLTQDIAGCSNKINSYLLQSMVSSQWQLTELMHTQLTKSDYIWQAMMMRGECLPAVMTVGCAVVVDATGEEHRMLLDQCCSFDRLMAFVPGILSKCRPDKAHIQQWYIDRGQFEFIIDDGTNMTQLTRESDIWSTIEPGTKIIMRVITTEVARRLSASYQCHCGKWNRVKINEVAVVNALKDGFTIICSYCERRFQITVTKGKKVSRKQGEQSQAKDHGPAIEEKSLIRNFLKKQVLEEEVSISTVSFTGHW